MLGRIDGTAVVLAGRPPFDFQRFAHQNCPHGPTPLMQSS